MFLYTKNQRCYAVVFWRSNAGEDYPCGLFGFTWLLFAEFEAYEHSVVGVEQVGEGGDGAVAAESAECGEDGFEFVGFEEQGELSAVEGYLNGGVGDASKIGEFEFFVGGVEFIGAVEGASGYFSVEGEVFVEGELAGVTVKSEFGELCVYFLFDG